MHMHMHMYMCMCSACACGLFQLLVCNRMWRWHLAKTYTLSGFLMRFLLIAALLPRAAAFASLSAPEGADLVLAETTRAVPEGLVLIRDTYQFENAEHLMTGFTPDSPGPHKLVVLTGHAPDAYETEHGAHDFVFALRRRAMEKAVTMQGHGMVVVQTPDYET